jgi:hypothetical protein
MFSNTSLALLTVLTSQWSPNHTSRAKMFVIKLPGFQQFINYGLLLTPAVALWNKTWIFQHSLEVKVGTKTYQGSEQEIGKRSSAEGCCFTVRLAIISFGYYLLGRTLNRNV